MRNPSSRGVQPPSYPKCWSLSRFFWGLKNQSCFFFPKIISTNISLWQKMLPKSGVSKLLEPKKTNFCGNLHPPLAPLLATQRRSRCCLSKSALRWACHSAKLIPSKTKRSLRIQEFRNGQCGSVSMESTHQWYCLTWALVFDKLRVDANWTELYMELSNSTLQGIFESMIFLFPFWWYLLVACFSSVYICMYHYTVPYATRDLSCIDRKSSIYGIER